MRLVLRNEEDFKTLTAGILLVLAGLHIIEGVLAQQLRLASFLSRRLVLQ